MMRLFILLVCLFCFTGTLNAQERLPEAPLANKALETRAKNLFTQLKCEVCQGQSIADSNAALAQDMRDLIRQKVSSGESDVMILTYFSTRYGDSILMAPPLTPRTWVLWLAPVLLVGLGFFLIFRMFRAQK